MQEDLRTELKSEYSESIKKTVIAFANTEGGTILIGLDDSGRVVGVENADETILKITSSIRDCILPDVIALTDVRRETLEGKTIIRIRVERGASRPYYLAGKGIRPEGVYVRHGASSIPASQAAILAMIRGNSPSAEERRSLDQELTFEQSSVFFEKHSLAFGTEQKKTLGLINRDNAYTVAAQLLSDQCPFSIKIARFSGTDKIEFQDRREFSGSLLAQAYEAGSYLALLNHRSSHFEGLERFDCYDYPPEAIRETLLNCIVHRDYSFSGPILISVYDNRMEFVSIGGLVGGLTKADMLLGVSQLRNPILGNVFYRLGLIEAYGTGTRKILSAYAGSRPGPQFDISDNAVRVTLPNRNSQAAGGTASLADFSAGWVAETEKRILAQLGRQPLSRNALQEKLGLSQTAILNALRSLRQKGSITQTRQGRSILYSLKR